MKDYITIANRKARLEKKKKKSRYTPNSKDLAKDRKNANTIYIEGFVVSKDQVKQSQYAQIKTIRKQIPKIPLDAIR